MRKAGRLYLKVFLLTSFKTLLKKETALSTSTGKVAVPIQQAAALTRVLQNRPLPGDRELAMSSEAYKTAAKDQYGASPEDIFDFLGRQQIQQTQDAAVDDGFGEVNITDATS